MKVLRFLFRLLIFGNIYISFAAALLSIEFRYLTSKEFDFELFWMVFFASFSLYNLQRLVLVHEESAESDQQKFVAANKKILWILTAAALVPGIGLFFTTLILQQQIVFGLGGLVALAYFVPTISLRKLPGLKAILVGLCWAIISGAVWWKGEWTEFPLPQFIDKFLFITALAILFDIRDYVPDKNSRTFSIPVLLGNTTARIIAFLMLASSAAILFCEDISLLPILVVFPLGLFLVLVSNNKRKEMFYAVGVDGIIILRALAMIFLSQNSIL